MTTIRLNGADNLVKNNTFYKTAASSTLNSGDRAIIEYNNLSESGFLQSDGALIHAMVNQQPNIKIRFNWCHTLLNMVFDSMVKEQDILVIYIIMLYGIVKEVLWLKAVN